MLWVERRERRGRAVVGEENLAWEVPVPNEAVPKTMRGGWGGDIWGGLEGEIWGGFRGCEGVDTWFAFLNVEG